VTPANGNSDAFASAEISVKFFVEDPAAVDLEELIPVFHRWIRENRLEGELPIDVAAYAHVPKGPGVVLVCDRAHYYFDEREGRPGLRYRGRRVPRGAGEEAITRAFGCALRAAALLEKDPSLGKRYRFRTNTVELGINDRLHAPSDERTLAVVRPAVAAAVRSVYGKPAKSVTLASGPREPFLARIEMAESPKVDTLLEQLAGAAS
jgi:hypothetical protein